METCKITLCVINQECVRVLCTVYFCACVFFENLSQQIKEQI